LNNPYPYSRISVIIDVAAASIPPRDDSMTRR